MSQVSESGGHTEKSWISGKSQFSHERSRVDVSEKVQGNQVHSRVQAKDEVLLSKTVPFATNTLRTRAVEIGVLTHGAEMGIDGDWACGRVWFKKKNYERRSVPAHTTHPPSWCTQEKLCQDGTRISRFCGRKPWTGRISEKQAAPRDASRGGAVSKEANEFVRFGDYHWSILCLQEFTASNGDVVIETAEGHRMFATPPCKGQRRLAIVVAAKGWNCAQDITCSRSLRKNGSKSYVLGWAGGSRSRSRS